MPVARICRYLSTRYGWTPNQIADMTLGQTVLYLGADKMDGEGNLSFGTIREALMFLEGFNG